MVRRHGDKVECADAELERMLLGGATNEQVAQALRCTSRTVRRLISKARAKYGESWGRPIEARPEIVVNGRDLRGGGGPDPDHLPAQYFPPSPPADLEDANAVAQWARAYFAWVATVPVAAAIDPARIRAAENLLRLTPPPAPAPPEPDHSDLLERVLSASVTAVDGEEDHDEKALAAAPEPGIH